MEALGGRIGSPAVRIDHLVGLNGHIGRSYRTVLTPDKWLHCFTTFLDFNISIVVLKPERKYLLQNQFVLDPKVSISEETLKLVPLIVAFSE